MNCVLGTVYTIELPECITFSLAGPDLWIKGSTQAFEAWHHIILSYFQRKARSTDHLIYHLIEIRENPFVQLEKVFCNGPI